MRTKIQGDWARHYSALAILLAGAVSIGCNAFAPSALGTLTASREEKRVLKQAAVDSFPSPEDVGLKKDGEVR